jgi:hypothetical protein
VTKHKTEEDWNIKPQYMVNQEPVLIAQPAPGTCPLEPEGDCYDSQDDSPAEDLTPDDPSSENITPETYDRLR